MRELRYEAGDVIARSGDLGMMFVITKQSSYYYATWLYYSDHALNGAAGKTLSAEDLRERDDLFIASLDIPFWKELAETLGSKKR